MADSIIGRRFAAPSRCRPEAISKFRQYHVTLALGSDTSRLDPDRLGSLDTLDSVGWFSSYGGGYQLSLSENTRR